MDVVSEWWIENLRGQARFEKERSGRAGDLLRAQRVVKEAAELATTVVTTTMVTTEAAKRDRARVPALLMVRLCDDLNALAVLIAEGLPIPAAALSASIWEKAHQVNTLSNDEERLSQWLTGAIDPGGHNPVSKSKSHIQAFERIRDFLHPELPWEVIHREYEELCNLKHAHPHAIRTIGIKEWTDDGLEMVFGPTTGAQTTALCEAIALYSLKALLWGSMGFLLANGDLVHEAQILPLSERFRHAFELVIEIQRNPFTEPNS